MDAKARITMTCEAVVTLSEKEMAVLAVIVSYDPRYVLANVTHQIPEKDLRDVAASLREKIEAVRNRIRAARVASHGHTEGAT